MWLMRKILRKKTRARKKHLLKNPRRQSSKARKQRSEAGKNAPQRNQKIPIRNESEPSDHCFWTESSDKMPSTQYVRPNFQPIYQLCWRKESYHVDVHELSTFH